MVETEYLLCFPRFQSRVEKEVRYVHLSEEGKNCVPPPWFHLSCRFVPKCWDTARRRRRYCRCLYELYIYCVGRGEKETYGCILWFTTPSIAKHEISSFAASTVVVGGLLFFAFVFCFACKTRAYTRSLSITYITVLYTSRLAPSSNLRYSSSNRRVSIFSSPLGGSLWSCSDWFVVIFHHAITYCTIYSQTGVVSTTDSYF